MTSRTVAERLFEAWWSKTHDDIALTRCEDGYLHEPTGLALMTREVPLAERWAIETLGGRHFNLCRSDGIWHAEAFATAIREAFVKEDAA